MRRPYVAAAVDLWLRRIIEVSAEPAARRSPAGGVPGRFAPER
jgi:hypothetical protein